MAASAAETLAAHVGGLPHSYALRCVRTCSSHVRGGEKQGLNPAQALAQAIRILVSNESGNIEPAEMREWMGAWSTYLLTLEKRSLT